MLDELHVRSLGVIADTDVVLKGGLTALTGETGAGKTLVVEALELLVGSRSDPLMVRSGAEELVVEGRFLQDDDEVVLRRVVPLEGRSRAFVDNKMAPLSALAELGEGLIDLHGQHAHQSLLRGPTQRATLDEFGGIELFRLRSLEREISAVSEHLDGLGGEERERERELDLLAFEIDEIERARITDAAEDERLSVEEDLLAGASALREASTAVLSTLEQDEPPGVLGLLGTSISTLSRHGPLDEHRARLASVLAELDDATSELRRASEGFEEDPERLSEVRERRELLRRLAKKHGGSLADVLSAKDRLAERLAELESTDVVRAELFAKRERLEAELSHEREVVGRARREAAARLGPEVEGHLAELGLQGARFSVALGEDPGGDEVEFLFGSNPGEPMLPLSKTASGGELARAMLAIRLVLTKAPPTLVFDEVDAGVGGEAARAIGEALARVGEHHQVLVVTHLAQVAAFADHHLVVEKSEDKGRTTAKVTEVSEESRVVELSRMLSGRPGSASAQEHARELLAAAGQLAASR